MQVLLKVHTDWFCKQRCADRFAASFDLDALKRNPADRVASSGARPPPTDAAASGPSGGGPSIPQNSLYSIVLVPVF